MYRLASVFLSDIFGQGAAQFGLALATILGQILKELAYAFDMNGVADEATIARGMKQPCAVQLLEVKRRGRRACTDGISNFASWKSVGTLFHQGSEHAQALSVSQGSQRCYGSFFIHLAIIQGLLNWSRG